MTITVFPVTPSFAAEIGDIDLSQPIEPSDYAAIDDAFAKYAVLIFPDQHLSQDRHLDFARHFGPLDVSIGVHRKDTALRVREELTHVSHAGRIFGMPEAEGRALIDELIAHATQRQFVYTHRWRVHDLVMWDDRCTMHHGTEFDDLRWKRDLQRATVCDVANSCEQEGIAPAAA